MGLIVYGTERVPGVSHIQVSMREQQAPPVRTAPETTRNDRQGVRQLKVNTLHKGLGVRRGAESSEDIQRLASSDGLWSHIFGQLTLPPVQTTQSISSWNTSGYRAANLRVHPVMTTIGQSKVRAHYFVGTKHLRTTSDSNPVLADSTMSNTNNVMGAFEGKLNDQRGIIVCTDGTTEDVLLVTDPTLTPPSETTAFALSGGDVVFGGGYLPLLGPGFNWFYGKIGGVSGLWYLRTDQALLTAPQPLMLLALADESNPDTAVQSTGVKYPDFVDQVRSFGSGEYVTNSTTWTNQNNVLDNDGNVATWAPGAGLTKSPMLYASQFGFDISDANDIIGVVAEVEAREAGAADLIIDMVAVLAQGGEIAMNVGADAIDAADAIGNNRATGTELNAAALTAIPYGGAADLWGAALTPAIVSSPSFGWLWGVYATGAADVASVDYMSINVYYRPKGTQASIPLGGQVLGPDPLDPNSFYILAPEFQDEAATVNVPRILWKLTFTYDEAGQRPVVRLEKVPTLQHHVECADFAQQSIITVGSNVAGADVAPNSVRRSEQKTASSWDVHDLNYIGAQGVGGGFSVKLAAMNVFGADRQCVVDGVEASQYTQALIENDGRWSALSAQESLAALGGLPLAYAETNRVDPTQRYRYRFYPDLSGNTRITRQYQPVNLMADPLAFNTSIVKDDTPLFTALPELDAGGPEEALKMLLTTWNLSRDVSSTNTISIYYATNGTSMTLIGTFTSFASKVTLSTPVLFRLLHLAFRAGHTAASTGTPNCLPALVEFQAVWPALRRWRVFLNPADPEFARKYAPGGIEKLFNNLQTQQLTLPVATFKPGNAVSKPATWEGMGSAYNASDDPAKTGYAQNPGDAVHFIDLAEVIQ